MTRQHYSSGSPWEKQYGYSRAVVAGPWIITAGCTSTRDGQVLHVGDPYAQALEAFAIALEAVSACGSSRDQVVRTRMYLTDPAHVDAVGRAHGELFAEVRPASTLVVVAHLHHHDHLVEVEVEAYTGPAL